MKAVALILLCFGSTSLAQQIENNPLREIGTNVFDFTPLIQSFRHGEISDSPFLVAGRISQINAQGVEIVHDELRLGLSQEFNKEMLSADSSLLLKMTYAAQLLDKWRKGQLSAGEFMSLDLETRQIIDDEIQREKQDYVAVTVFVKNLPHNYLTFGKAIRVLALPIAVKTTDSESLPQFDYGNPISEDRNSFTNKFFVTARGYIKQQIPKKNNLGKTNAPAILNAGLH
jgi:hypothetical protein